jgi:hypothetical protein
MGALTSKLTAFTYRVWEQRSFIEIDDSEVYSYKIRSENLKIKRVRILPIGYWISDGKRYVTEALITRNISIFFELLRYLIVNTIINENRHCEFLIPSIKGYKKILNILISLKNKINCFLAKKTTKDSVQNNLTLIYDLLVNNSIVKRKDIPALTVNNFNTNILFFTNPRLDSPVLHTFFFKLIFNHFFTSFSTFISNITKEEVPLSNCNLIASVQGYYKLMNKTILTSCLNIAPLTVKLNPAVLTPIYTPYILEPFIKESLNKESLLSTGNPLCLFYNPLIKMHVYQSITEDTTLIKSQDCPLLLAKHISDQFYVKKVNHKWLSRLFFNLSLVFTIRTYTAIRYIIIVGSWLWENAYLTYTALVKHTVWNKSSTGFVYIHDRLKPYLKRYKDNHSIYNSCIKLVSIMNSLNPTRLLYYPQVSRKQMPHPSKHLSPYKGKHIVKRPSYFSYRPNLTNGIIKAGFRPFSTLCHTLPIPYLLSKRYCSSFISRYTGKLTVYRNTILEKLLTTRSTRFFLLIWIRLLFLFNYLWMNLHHRFGDYHVNLAALALSMVCARLHVSGWLILICLVITRLHMSFRIIAKYYNANITRLNRDFPNISIEKRYMRSAAKAIVEGLENPKTQAVAIAVGGALAWKAMDLWDTTKNAETVLKIVMLKLLKEIKTVMLIEKLQIEIVTLLNVRQIEIVI